MDKKKKIAIAAVFFVALYTALDCLDGKLFIVELICNDYNYFSALPRHKHIANWLLSCYYLVRDNVTSFLKPFMWWLL